MASEPGSAAARVRREAASVHHVLCDLRRPPVGTPKCTCRMAEVGRAMADLLDSVHAALPWIDSTPGRGATAAILRQRAAALEAAILGSGQ